MRSISLSFALLFVLAISSFAQMPTFRYTYDVGLFDIAGGMVQNPAGEFVVAGLNNSLGPYYGNVFKINSAGTVLWANAYTSGFASNFSDIKNVSTGGYIVTGSSTSGGGGAVLVRLDNNGNVLWANRYQLPNHPTGNASSEYGTSVIETTDGGFLVGGGVDYFWDGVSLNTVDTSSAMGFKVDAAGNLLWNRVWVIPTANPDEHYINDVAESADGYFFVGESSEGAGTPNSDGDYPRNALIIKTATSGTLTYIRRWGVGNTTSQGINSAVRLSTGNILLGGYDDLHGFIISISGTGVGTPAVIFNRRLNGSIFANVYLIQDIMENSDGNYSIIGTQLAFLAVSFNTMIVKINSSSGALMFGRTYAPIGLSAILPEGGLASDQGYYISMTDQQVTGFNYNIIRTNPSGQTNDPAVGCPGTALSPALGTITVAFTTPAMTEFNLLTRTAFVPVITPLSPVRTQHCLNIPSVLSTTATSTNVACFGGCTGTGTANPTGGTAPYTYLWNPTGQVTQVATGLCAVTYTVTVTDNVGATATTTVVITQPASAVSASITSSGNVSCNGGSNGTATVTPSGGTPGYTYSWAPSGGTNPTATGLVANTYTVTVTDANGCTTTQTVTITQPAALTLSTSSTPSGCVSPTGTATATPGGGTPGYTYNWNPSAQTTPVATALGAGTYTVTVTDANGCTITQTIVVSTAGAPALTLSSQTNVLCNGGSTGSANMTASGGTSPYTYSWSPSGGTNANATGLAANTYTVTVTDANGCTATQTVIITQPTAIGATISSTQTGCSSSTGTATVTPSGGTPGYTYVWNPTSQVTQTATGLGAGTYTVTITDANNCTFTQTVSVTVAGAPSVLLSSQVNVSCNGGNDGSAIMTASGGTSPYTYSWAPAGGTNANATGLTANTYTITVTDANGCTATQVVTILQPTAISIASSSTLTGCTTAVGTATATPTGGTPGYTYLWSNSQVTQTATGLAAGTYTVTVTDANGCTMTQTVIVSANNTLALTASSASANCTSATGTATANPSGGTAPYTYLWSNSQVTQTATGLVAGTYTVTVTDVNGCTITQTVTVTSINPLTISSSSTQTGCGSPDGTATGTAGNGTTPYTYSWSNGQTTQTATGLSAGTYTITITDANGCTITQSVAVTQTTGPVATASASVTTITVGGSAQLTASGGGTYLWTPSTALSCTTCPNPIATPAQTTTYCVTVIDTNGCSDSSCVTITVDIPCGKIFVPNAFSPNFDTENDQECIEGNCIKALYFAIYDRWGEKVFETSNPAMVCWDGMYKGKILSPQVFVYYLDATLINDEVVSKKGNITLVK